MQEPRRFYVIEVLLYGLTCLALVVFVPMLLLALLTLILGFGIWVWLEDNAKRLWRRLKRAFDRRT